ncbi:MAG: hypothetical protein IJE09_05400 [Oscillospiraceae bacterium]|nr:hypothetical protein [Oscillospiraceae bacterium]
MNGKRFSLLLIIILVCALLCGCSKKPEEPAVPTSVTLSAGEFQIDTTTELAIVLQSGETQLLDQLTALKSADFSGSECVDEIYAWAQNNPQVKVTYTVTLPDGTVLDTSAKSADLSAMGSADIRSAAEVLRYLPELESIELGSERSGMGWEDIDVLKQACPDVKFKYLFDLYGKEMDLQNTQINLSHVPVNDGGAYVKQVMAYMPDLTYLDMDTCGVSNEDMAAIRDAYPDVKVVWRIWFGDAYSVRTDVERILASAPSKGGMLNGDNTDVLKYCTDVRFLDLGHNDDLWDIDFVAYMSKLEVAILAMACWTDASPLANCKNLEYLEMQTTLCTDLSPLSELKNLRHLNIAYNYELCDISPLYGLTELERLWIGCINPVPAEQVAQMQAAAPNCEINTEVYIDPVGGRWRYVDYNELAYMYIYHDRYILLREQFDDYASTAFSFYWNDPLY